MKNKVIITSLCVLLIGCASTRYPGWERVTELDSAYKQPCREVGANQDYDKSSSKEEWLKKRTAANRGNRFVVTEKGSDYSNAVYFYCGEGVPIYMKRVGAVSVVSGEGTKADYGKSLLKCNYELHKAMIGKPRHAPTRAYIPTNNYWVNEAQHSAIHNDRFYNDLDDFYERINTADMFSECLEIDGFKQRKSQEASDFDAVDKNCPTKNDLVEGYCFVPAGK